ncbi:hypothetical protein E3N88_09973 [Mikania micrantha]|uniref:Uncharacterized protein n=1 Tax=Mikania micrantha TaxID=192012 RepID=A0A5N6PB32_9ASTR|nr:hypothetical protein E3N88_09973 [Mikania micrantha]
MSCWVFGGKQSDTAAAKKKKRGRRKGIFVTFDLATFPADFPEFQASDRLHFWTASSSYPEEFIQRWVLFNNVRKSGFRAPVHSRLFVGLGLRVFHVKDEEKVDGSGDCVDGDEEMEELLNVDEVADEDVGEGVDCSRRSKGMEGF